MFDLLVHPLAPFDGLTHEMHHTDANIFTYCLSDVRFPIYIYKLQLARCAKYPVSLTAWYVSFRWFYRPSLCGITYAQAPAGQQFEQ